ncbi:intein [Lentzea atacamensis]|uniref:Intein n=1 Tax=Lentzea atacamensis TaxID=531938 RepID=A0ABX9E1N0_9PSEU|nr:Hint domain-containing protein [Lentzea atacamensis]RAS61089.1 intein [Lentzea atacamensis]
MADGSRKPIKDVKPGDRVIATDPTTGKTSIKVVTDQRVHESERELYEISVLTLKGVGKITATDAHPFRVSSLREWKHAEDLKPGYRFTTADNRPATVLGTRSFSKVQLVYNLTVDGTHTYYVGAAGRGQSAAADVLVHNCGDGETGTEGDAASPTSLWVPDENYSDAAIAGRTADTAAREQFWTVEKDVRALVSDLVSNDDCPQRRDSDGVRDFKRDQFNRRGENITPIRYRRMHGMPIFYNGDDTSLLRVVSNPKTGEMWYTRNHNYDNLKPVKWATRTPRPNWQAFDPVGN